MDLQERATKAIEQAVKENLVAGANLLVLKDGEEVLYAQAGLADVEEKKEFARDSIIRLYSQTKPITAAAAMILMERGEIDPVQSVGEFIPAFHKLTVEKTPGERRAAYTPLTVQNLLNMTSGLPYPGDDRACGIASAKVFDEACSRIGTDHEMSTLELAERLAEGPLAYDPGTSWEYGTSADVLGAVIEKVTGMRLADFMEQEIFKPLGMKDTAFYVPAAKQARLAKVYETVYHADGTTGMIPYTGDNLAVCNRMDHQPGYMAGGAGLASTLDDYSRFATMLMNGGTYEGTRVLKPQTVRFMTGAELMPAQQAGFDSWIGLSGFSYGNLMRICKNPGQAGFIAGRGEYGWDGWLGAYFANLPEERLTILMGTQKKDAGTFSLTRKLRNIVVSELC